MSGCSPSIQLPCPTLDDVHRSVQEMPEAAEGEAEPEAGQMAQILAFGPACWDVRSCPLSVGFCHGCQLALLCVPISHSGC